jgi:hypothetical protein
MEEAPKGRNDEFLKGKTGENGIGKREMIRSKT